MPSDVHLPGALRALGDALRAAELTLAVPGRDEAAATRRELLDQVEDYLLPRLEQMDAPLLMVVGGSTGAGSRRSSTAWPARRSARPASCAPRHGPRCSSAIPTISRGSRTTGSSRA